MARERKGMRARIEDLISKSSGKPADVAEEVDAEGNVTGDLPEGADAVTAQTPAEDAKTLGQLEAGKVSASQALSQIDPEMFAGQAPEAPDMQTMKQEALSRAMGDVETWSGGGDWSYEKHERPNGEVYIIASKGDIEAIVEPGDKNAKGEDIFEAIMLERTDPEAFKAGRSKSGGSEEPATPSTEEVIEAAPEGGADEAEPAAEAAVEDLGTSEQEDSLGESITGNNLDPEAIAAAVTEGIASGDITAVGNAFDPEKFGAQVSSFFASKPAAPAAETEKDPRTSLERTAQRAASAVGRAAQDLSAPHDRAGTLDKAQAAVSGAPGSEAEAFKAKHGRYPRNMAELKKYRQSLED